MVTLHTSLVFCLVLEMLMLLDSYFGLVVKHQEVVLEKQQ